MDMKDSETPENLVNIENAKRTLERLEDTEYMATYDTFITFKQEGQVYALALWDIPDFVKAWQTALML